MILSVLKTVVRSKYFYIGLGIIFLGYLGLRIHLLKCTIEERDFTITQLKVNNSNLEGTIKALASCATSIIPHFISSINCPSSVFHVPSGNPDHRCLQYGECLKDRRVLTDHSEAHRQ